MTLARLAIEIYEDHARRHGRRSGARNIPQIRQIVDGCVSNAFTPLPDPAAPVVAARLLHQLVATRRDTAVNVGSAWAVTETYLLVHGCIISAGDDEVGHLLAAVEQGSTEPAATVSRLAGWLGTVVAMQRVP